jgi:general secretion pathway protein H
MQTLEAGSKARSRGFTLLELLVVLVIVALVSVGVGFSMRDSSQVQLDREAERLAALLESARARSQVSGVPVRWRAQPGGFRFEGLAATELPQQWLDADTRAVSQTSPAQAATLLLGPEPVIGPQSVVLTSSSQSDRQVRIATDGVRPFALAAP